MNDSLREFVPWSAYRSHRWVGNRQYIPGEPDEWFAYCDVCGMENGGDPAEFPKLIYPACGSDAD